MNKIFIYCLIMLSFFGCSNKKPQLDSINESYDHTNNELAGNIINETAKIENEIKQELENDITLGIIDNVQREFNDIIYLDDEIITLIDRTNEATDLKARDIHKKIEIGIKRLENITGFFFKLGSVYHKVNNNRFVIYVDGGTYYENYKVNYDNDNGYTVSFHQDFIISNDANVMYELIFHAVYDDIPA